MARDTSILALLDRGLYHVSRPLLWATTWILRIGLRRIGLPGRLDGLAENQRALEARLVRLQDGMESRAAAAQAGLEALHRRLDALDLAMAGVASSARGRHHETQRQLDEAGERLAALRSRQVIPVGADRLLVRTDDGFIACPQRALAVVAALAWDDAHPCRETGLCALVRRLLRPGDAAVDLAPGLGVLALAMARAVGPEGRIVIVAEPPAAGPLVDTMVANRVEGRVTLRDATGGATDLTTAPERTLVLRLPDDAPPASLSGLGDVLRRSPDLIVLATLGPSGSAASQATAAAWLSAAQACGLDRLMTVDPASGRCGPLPALADWVARGGGTLLMTRAISAAAQRLPF